MAEKMRARVIRVRVDRHGGTLAVAASIGDTTLSVKDAGDFAFDEVEDGTLQVDDDAGTLLDYNSIEYVEDDDPSDLVSNDTITLTAPLTVAIPANTSLWVYEAADDEDEDTQVAEVIAKCIPEGDEDAAETGEPVWATVPDKLQDDLPVGRQSGKGVPVVLEWDDETDEWSVARIRGRRKRAVQWEDDDPYTITDGDVAAGLVTHQLKHLRIVARSMQVTWGRVQPPTSYSVDVDNGVLTYTLDGKERVGDVLDCQYQYIRGEAARQRTTTVLVDWQASGWKHLQVATSDSTNRSATGFDDSSWAIDPAAFARYLSSAHPYGYPTASAAWAYGTKMWLRRTVAVPSGATSVTVKVRVDDQASVYWNGTLVGSGTSIAGGTTLHEFTVPVFTAGADDTLAVVGTDSPSSGSPSAPSNWTYLDARVEAVA